MYDGFLLVSFGGPEHRDEVMPFLRNVTRGRGVPPERLAEVAEHYHRFGGVSPINQQCRELVAAIRADFAVHGLDLPVYWGNRNWRPLLADTLAEMRDHGIERAVAFVTSAYGSYSSCHQYLEDIVAARATVGSGAPAVDKLRHFFDHQGFVEPFADATKTAFKQLDATAKSSTRIVFTAHSIPVSMARSAGPQGGLYEAQLRETATLVARRSLPGVGWDLVWQSRSGPPHVPWLEPDVNEHLRLLAKEGVKQVVVAPIGFISDHLEVVWDLDEEAAATARQLGLGFARARTPGTDARFVAMVRDLVSERVEERMRQSSDGVRRGLGRLDHWDVCASHCCPAPARP